MIDGAPVRLALLCLALAACDGGAAPDGGVDAGGGDAGAVEPPVVETTLGPVRGRREPGVLAFEGIPYAAPPIGELRWRPPQPPEPWTKPHPATGRPPRCVQQALGLELSSREDCLYLNVHAPDPLPEGAPVMVWIHGGGFIFGEGLQTDGGTAGDRLAAAHGVVVVSMNYRLGPFGFLAHPALADEQGGTSGNYGLQDQRAALEWVRDNIAAFGGAPDDVTIFGESAGGFSVCAHLISPASAGLFHRAISQSGLCDTVMATAAQAMADGQAFAEAAGCADEADPLACLRAQRAEDLRAADPSGTRAFTELGGRRVWWPHVDGALLPGDFRARVEADAFARVPTVIGWNADEGTLFVMLAEQAGTVTDEATYDATLADLADSQGVSVDDVRAQYPLAAYPEPGAAIAAAIGDAALACPSRRAAHLLAEAGADVRVYHFTYPDASFQLPAERELGAFHSAEIQYVFGYPSAVGRTRFVGDDRALSEAMSAYWAGFASGGPGGDPAWPTYDLEGDAHLVLDRTVATATGADADACALWGR
ncbi:MAG TPA: carboxylesterase family protein [Sandaracinaceae bacterium LLY-WYZ-13_1]|nr:carboxylesterase family protein [Sandaracinaceae bacterium LLY-WYZ-13_1]